MDVVASKRKIVLALAAVVLSAAIGFVLVMGVVFSAEAKMAKDLLQSYTESVAHGISAFFVEARTAASAAATLNSVQNLDWDAAALEFMGFIRTSPYIQRISLVDADGNIYDAFATGAAGNRWQGGRRTADNSDPNAEPANVSGREYFRRLVTDNERGEFIVMTNEVYFPYMLGGKVFATTASIIKEGKAIGIVNVAQTAMELSLLYEDIAIDFLERFGKDGHIYIISYGGELVSRLEYNARHGAYMDELFGSDETVPVSVLGEDAVAAIDAAVRTNKLVISFKINNRSHYVAGIKIADTPFAVCLAVSIQQMLNASRHIAFISTFFFLLTAFIGCFAFFAIVKERPPRPKKKPKPRSFKRPKGFSENLAPPELPPDSRG